VSLFIGIRILLSSFLPIEGMREIKFGDTELGKSLGLAVEIIAFGIMMALVYFFSK